MCSPEAPKRRAPHHAVQLGAALHGHAGRRSRRLDFPGLWSTQVRAFDDRAFVAWVLLNPKVIIRVKNKDIWPVVKKNHLCSSEGHGHCLLPRFPHAKILWVRFPGESPFTRGDFYAWVTRQSRRRDSVCVKRGRISYARLDSGPVKWCQFRNPCFQVGSVSCGESTEESSDRINWHYLMCLIRIMFVWQNQLLFVTFTNRNCRKESPGQRGP